MPQLTLRHCSIADVLLGDDNERIVKINVNEEDFFFMLDNVNPKNIIKYLDMRGVPHREALQINIKTIDGRVSRRNSTIKKLVKRGKKKLNRVRELLPSYGDNIEVNNEGSSNNTQL